MGSGVVNEPERAETSLGVPPGSLRHEDKKSESPPRSPVTRRQSPAKSGSPGSIHAANDEDLEERLRLMDRDGDLLLDDDEVLNNLDGYSDVDERNKDSHESDSSDGHQNNRESWNMLKRGRDRRPGDDAESALLW